MDSRKGCRGKENQPHKFTDKEEDMLCHVMVYLNGNPMMGKLFKVKATSNDEAQRLALEEARKLFGEIPEEEMEKFNKMMTKTTVVVGRPGHECACSSCDKPLAQVLMEN